MDINKNLYYLENLSGYSVENDDKDVRGWEVMDKDRRVVGKVDNLIVNKNTERVVYLEVDVDESIIDSDYEPYRMKASKGIHTTMNEDGENHLIIPIGMVDLDLDKENVYTDKIDHRTFAETKRYKGGYENINREYEIYVLESYERPASRYKNEDKNSGVDFDHDNDGNPNITDPDYYEKKGKDIANADYDNDNDGNPNITDPDYYEEKLDGDKYDGDKLYERREYDSSRWKKNS